MAQPWYGEEHRRIRAALLAAFVDGQLCSLCKEPMFRTQKLDLGHVSDSAGRSIPGRWAGLQHATCNHSSGGQVNPYGVRNKPPRSPERIAAIAARDARRQRKSFRAEFDAAQKQE